MPSPVGYSYSSTVKLTGNAQIDSLIFGTKWMYMPFNGDGFTSLTYSFVTPGQSMFVRNYTDNNEYQNPFALTAVQQNAVKDALGAWSAVANVKFTFVNETTSNVGDLRFGGYSDMPKGTVAWAYMPDDTPRAGDVWIGPQTDSLSPTKGSYDYLTFAHESGHALGLKHPFSAGIANYNTLPPALDDVRYTIMSYHDAYDFLPTTPMTLDIAAIQNIYGANTQWQAGNTTYSWAPDQSIFETIWDGGGNDTIDGSNQTSAVIINLNEGQFSQIGKAFLNLTTNTLFNQGLAIAYGAKIENAVGSSLNDVLIGNDLDNVLDGRGGADTMTGGAGNDTYVVDNVGDVVIETGTSASEIDTVISWVNYSLGANVENLTLLGSENLTATGNGLNNVLTGNAGDNVLNGGAGADVMIGGAGNDTYLVENAGDIVVETGTSATEIDTVLSSISYALGANVENLVLLGTANLTAVGNSLNNTLFGNDGNNILDGQGGADVMNGGAGNDIYLVDNAGDVVIETGTSAAEIDTVMSWINYRLTANVENLTMLGGDSLSGVGNELNNVLTGNAGNNVLDGQGGADIMNGGAGNDSYVVDNVGDVVIETGTSASEIDTVFSWINYSLGANVENLTLLGSDNLTATGNGLNNVLTGNAGDNVLNGGAGADVMIGGAGNDTYLVENAGDIVVETGTSATEIDTVLSSISYALGANVENLVLLGNANLSGVGNNLNNMLFGNDGNNILDGQGGADIMNGGAGNDTYLVDNVGDVVIETGTSPTEIDTVMSWISYSLTANVENLTLLGSDNFNGTGNNLNNVLIGNAGNNILNGGAGADTLTGGGGADTFVFGAVNEMGIGANRDVITDFNSAQGDKIDLTKFDANLLTAGVNGFSFIGANAFTGAGQLRFVDHVLSGNVSGNAGADFEIQLVGVNTFSAHDLVA